MLGPGVEQVLGPGEEQVLGLGDEQVLLLRCGAVVCVLPHPHLLPQTHPLQGPGVRGHTCSRVAHKLLFIVEDMVRNTSLEAGLLVLQIKIPSGIHLLGSSGSGICFEFFWGHFDFSHWPP